MKQFPVEALDQRLGFVGTSGSGKTYGAGVLVEKLLHSRRRTVIIDPLGVWYGLRADPAGKPSSAFPVVIFGGPHGDLGISQHAGGLIGEAVADTAESCIIDLSQLGTKAAERRFMLAFLDALYRNTKGTPVHTIFDEADMWAPQKLLDKEGEAAKLQGMMETLVRRGRVRGFIPWLITQRPAVLSKDILSQVDGLAIFKLTSSQDRQAIGAWVEGQADAGQWRQIHDALPGQARGHAVVWLPSLGVLEGDFAFPAKATFDSSATPKRGEKRNTADLKPLDVGRLKERLQKVETEAKANDPKALRARIAELERQAKAVSTASLTPASNPGLTEKALARAVEQARRDERNRVLAEIAPLATQLAEGLKGLQGQVQDLMRRAKAAPSWPSPPQQIAPVPVRSVPPAQVARASLSAATTGELAGPLQKVVDAIRWWNVLGITRPTHPQVAFVAGYSHKSGTWATHLSRLRSGGMVEGRGELTLTPKGAAAANEPEGATSGEELRRIVLSKIDAPLARILTPILAAWPNGQSQADVAAAAGYSHSSGTWATYLSRLRSLDLIDGRGELRAQDWLFP